MVLNSVSEEDRKALLETIGCKRASDLFSVHGLTARSKPGAFPKKCSEFEIDDSLRRFSRENMDAESWPCFFGGGVYHHFVPGAVEEIARKQEFWTPHLPTYPEISQGTLTVLFEYQSLITRLTGMEVGRCPVGSAGEALAGALMAVLKRFPRGGKILVPLSVNPHYVNQARWMLAPTPLDIEPVPFLEDGSLDLQTMDASLGPEIKAVVFQSPNYFGVIENSPAIVELTRAHDAILIQVVGDPLSLALLKPPAEFDVDIACGDLQSLGLPMWQGGFTAGFVVAAREFLDSLPGRLVAETEDLEGRRVFVDIADELPAFNTWGTLFSNSIWPGFRVVAYLALLGGTGIRRVALLSHRRAAFARAEALNRGLTIPTSDRFFDEFVVELNAEPFRLSQVLREEGLLGGIPVGEPDIRPRWYLFAFTEMNREEDIARLMEVLAKIS